MIDNINDLKIKLGGKVTLRKTGKIKVDSELSAKAFKSSKRKRVGDGMVWGKAMTDCLARLVQCSM